MKPLRLTMQAFGSYGKKTSINFEAPNQNLFLITGDTGAGKTTIFDAVVFALYGEASSETNKRDGDELQSQFVQVFVEPFVELEFSEGTGEEKCIYTVRRIPKHKRPLKRGTGEKEESEKVSLIMPDGSEYPQKETDKKLEEIVGLTKAQFMQVAMIAQGEFMELLRAKSDDKKKIFRKLFHTELYQEIADELGRRKKEKEREIAAIKTICQTEAARIIIPEDYEEREELEKLKEKMVTADKLVITDMELLAKQLELLCRYLEENKEKAKKEYAKASEMRDKKRDEYTNAVHLLKFFEQLDQAKKDLEQCRKEEEEGENAASLIGQIRDAYEIKTEFERYREVFKRVEDTDLSLEKQQKALPGLEELEKEAAGKEEEAKNLFEQELKHFSAISERVEKALDRFEKIEATKEEVAAKEKALNQAERIAQQAKRDLSQAEAQEKEWKNQAEELKDAKKLLALWEGKRREADSLEEEAAVAIRRQKEVKQQSKESQDAKKAYSLASEAYNRRQAEYQIMRESFLNAQAGFLADELQPGKPCPVCGSLEHPKPYQWTKEREEFSKEALDALEKEINQLQVRQEELAAQSKSKADLLTEKEMILQESMKKLRQGMKAFRSLQGCIFQGEEKNRIYDSQYQNWDEQGDQKKSEGDVYSQYRNQQKCMNENIPESAESVNVGNGTLTERNMADIPEEMEPEQAMQIIAGWNKQIEAEGERLNEHVRMLTKIQKSLSEVDEKKENLKELVEQTGKELTAAAAALEGSRAVLKGFEAEKEYPTAEAAKQKQQEAKERKEKKEREYRQTHEITQKATAEKHYAETLIEKYRKELPEQKAEAKKRRESYETLMFQKSLKETEWIAITEKYEKKEADELQKNMDAHNRKKASAEAMESAAKKAIGKQRRPDLKAAQEEKEQAEERQEKAEAILGQYKNEYQENLKVYNALAPKLEERAEMVEKHAKLDTLYRLVSGNVKGSRMDLETYVQRYHLERILHRANKRFYHMSAGQFELRMFELEKAGEGKNRGLDLMVYSTVTGKEREIRTLSGGESFMAALSLALGMADQIQETSAAIHLDMMFIDEGFGSLDEHSRSQAVRVLQEMAGGSRLIGIISHVTELKQEIENQLIVKKDENGSYVRWQIS